MTTHSQTLARANASLSEKLIFLVDGQNSLSLGRLRYLLEVVNLRQQLNSF